MYKTIAAFLCVLINQIFFFISFLFWFFDIHKRPKNSSAKYYQYNKEILQEKAREKYHSLSKEEKEKKQQWGHLYGCI